MKQEELKTLLYDEIAKCNRCGFCLAHCPVYAIEGREWATPRGKNAIVRAIIEGRIGWTPEIEEALYRCTGCRLCTQTCFPAVETNQGVLAGRACLANMHQYPKIADRIVQALESDFNISGDPNEDRSQWMDFLKEGSGTQVPEGEGQGDLFCRMCGCLFPSRSKNSPGLRSGPG